MMLINTFISFHIIIFRTLKFRLGIITSNVFPD